MGWWDLGDWMAAASVHMLGLCSEGPPVPAPLLRYHGRVVLSDSAATPALLIDTSAPCIGWIRNVNRICNH